MICARVPTIIPFSIRLLNHGTNFRSNYVTRLNFNRREQANTIISNTIEKRLLSSLETPYAVHPTLVIASTSFFKVRREGECYRESIASDSGRGKISRVVGTNGHSINAFLSPPPPHPTLLARNSAGERWPQSRIMTSPPPGRKDSIFLAAGIWPRNRPPLSRILFSALFTSRPDDGDADSPDHP